MLSRQFQIHLVTSGIVGFAIILLLGSCASSNQSLQSSLPSLFATHHLPLVATPDYHPDSVGAASLSADSSEITLSERLPSLLRKWSVSNRHPPSPSNAHRPFRSILGGRSANTDLFAGRTGQVGTYYATLQSKELLLARLYQQSLSSNELKRAIARKGNFYADTLQIDLYYLSNAPLIERPRDVRATLEDDRGNEYPLLDQSFKINSTSFQGTRISYLRTSLYFDRSVEGKDLFKDASQLRLEAFNVAPHQQGARYFEWHWDSSGLASRE